MARLRSALAALACTSLCSCGLLFPQTSEVLEPVSTELEAALMEDAAMIIDNVFWVFGILGVL